ncbi:MAG: uracil-DNA glycosylase [Pseudomonadota bacterium]
MSGARSAPAPLGAPNRLRQPLAQLLDDPACAALGDWGALVRRWRDSPTGAALRAAVDGRLAAGATVYPADPLRALRLTPLAATCVVILGQDPYHGPGQAEGLAFSVPPGVRPPPSLRNVFAELARDLAVPPPASGSLAGWARQGVLLLNAALTVEDGAPGSHARLGWAALTDAVVEAAAAAPAPKAFLLWGAHAQAQAGRIARAGPAHLVLCANHPSPLSARRPPLPFIGCGHFGQAQRFLAERGRPTPDWSRPGDVM